VNKKYYKQQNELFQLQRECRADVIADLRGEERVLHRQLQESEERIFQLRREHHQELSRLRECFLQLSTDDQCNEEITSFDDLDQYHTKSDETFIRLAQQVKPMEVEGNHIAVLGSTSRGKSTMINSLLGKYEAEVGIGEVTTKCEPYIGLNFVLWDTPGRNDDTIFNHESIALWKSMKYRLILIENTVKENSKMMKLFDQINLSYDIIANKFDLVKEEEQTPFREQIRREIKTLKFKQINSLFFLSAKYPPQFSDWITLVNYLTSSIH